MRKLVIGSLMFLFVCLLFGSEVQAAWRSETPLLTINGEQYSKDDFLNWWKHWNDKGALSLPESLDDYIDFKIMVQQALAMEYDKNPDYLRKIGVYLKVRSLMMLQYEEVNSKVNITENDIRQNFNERFSPIWDLQILTFKNGDEADAAYDKMQPFAGKAAGQLVFADLQGTGESLYEEAEVSPEAILKAKRSKWLEIIRPLQEGFVSKPQAVGDRGQFVLFRINEIKEPQEEIYEKKKDRIKHELYKKGRGEMTSDLLKKLKKKFHLSVDKKLFSEIDIDQEYPDDFLARPIVSLDDLDITVGQFIMNARKDKIRRPGAKQAFVKNNILNGIVSQVLIDKESLARHYELADPLKNTWEFYTQNRLRVTMEAQIRKGIKIDEDDLNKFYENNQENFSVPAKVTYALIKGKKELVQKIWAGQLHGQSAMEIAQKHGVEPVMGTSTEGSLEEELKSVIAVTKKGETSTSFQYQGSWAIVKILGKIPAEKRTLDRVRKDIRNEMVKSRFKKDKEAYIKELRERSEIKVNNKVWEEIKKK